MKENFREEMRCIGMKIAGFRKMRNMTQEELAYKLNINKSYLSQIENGSANKNVSMPMLIRIVRTVDANSVLIPPTRPDLSAQAALVPVAANATPSNTATTKSKSAKVKEEFSMGFFSDLGGAILNSAKNYAEESREYYNEAMSMSREDLRDELRRIGNSTANMAKRNGYMKAAKERGIR